MESVAWETPPSCELKSDVGGANYLATMQQATPPLLEQLPSKDGRELPAASSQHPFTALQQVSRHGSNAASRTEKASNWLLRSSIILEYF